ncbi:UNKNOWN [Stylonychia lemnae]|uniref:Uncharacterized protein n=1 Tax=Stylonychia lemnae TaxID=5949 RepID=A0A077ZWW5_STYLE|nr:UNKNOWN [Stylonychia lemnae]|eukprot:CDW73777.1 UNKNOWN [Stylonychia lemnae]
MGNKSSRGENSEARGGVFDQQSPKRHKTPLGTKFVPAKKTKQTAEGERPHDYFMEDDINELIQQNKEHFRTAQRDQVVKKRVNMNRTRLLSNYSSFPTYQAPIERYLDKSFSINQDELQDFEKRTQRLLSINEMHGDFERQAKFELTNQDAPVQKYYLDSRFFQSAAKYSENLQERLSLQSTIDELDQNILQENKSQGAGLEQKNIINQNKQNWNQDHINFCDSKIDIESLDSMYNLRLMEKSVDFSVEFEDEEIETEILPSTHNQIRSKYITKLAHNKVLRTSIRNTKKQTIIIFDWDDTLFFTSAVKPECEQDIKAIIKVFQPNLTALDELVSNLLLLSLNDASPIIVTNAKQNWVYICAEQMMPKTMQVLRSNIPVVSARDYFESQYPNNAKEWKTRTFLSLIDGVQPFIQADGDLITNLIVIGDQNNDIQAGIDLSKQIGKCLLKSIKLSEQPGISELLKQLSLVTDQWDYIVNYHKGLEVELRTLC